MPNVTAMQNFEHNGPRKKGARFPVSELIAKKLQQAGLVIIDGDSDESATVPTKAAGAKRSASPAARASATKTSKPSAGGAKATNTSKATKADA